MPVCSHGLQSFFLMRESLGFGTWNWMPVIANHEIKLEVFRTHALSVLGVVYYYQLLCHVCIASCECVNGNWQSDMVAWSPVNGQL